MYTLRVKNIQEEKETIVCKVDDLIKIRRTLNNCFIDIMRELGYPDELYDLTFLAPHSHITSENGEFDLRSGYSFEIHTKNEHFVGDIGNDQN